MRRFHLKKDSNGNSAGENERLQEKLVEKYFQGLDLDAVHTGVHDARFDSKKVYDNITDAIDNEVVQAKPTYTKWLVAASLACVFIVSSWYYRYAVLNFISPVPTLEIAAANGNVTHITLGDGTKIWLNGGSKLKYPETFRGELREISIEGEAFFDVAHDADRPFIIHTGDISTHVLGTSFNIKAYPDEQLLKVDVLSGKVGIVPSVNAAVEFKTVFLTPAQGVVYNKTNRTISKSSNTDLTVLTTWKEGKLVFKKSPLPEVIKTLHRKFNYNIKADDNLSGCFITADFTNVPLKDIMAVIAKLVKGKATFKDNAYYLKGKGCQ